MISNEEQVRAAIAEQAADWLVANDEGPDAREAAALAAWLKASPLHVEEFLHVSVIARDLREARAYPEYALENVLARARTEDDTSVRRPLWVQTGARIRIMSSRRWLAAAVTMAAVVGLSFGLPSLWRVRPLAPVPAAAGTTALHVATDHGEQLSRRLADNSVVNLNADSAVTIRFSKTERLVTLTSGQAEFEVAHDPARAFRVLAGSAEVVAIGTQFDVRLQEDATVVTVLEGRVAVGPSPTMGRGTNVNDAPRYVQVSADQQIRVTAAEWPATPVSVDAQHTVAWLHREVVFDHEPLVRVAAEFNRYAPKPIEIATPTLRNLQISGAFATDDTDAFLAFLRTVKGVRVEVTPTRIQVSQH